MKFVYEAGHLNGLVEGGHLGHHVPRGQQDSLSLRARPKHPASLDPNLDPSRDRPRCDTCQEAPVGRGARRCGPLRRRRACYRCRPIAASASVAKRLGVRVCCARSLHLLQRHIVPRWHGRGHNGRQAIAAVGEGGAACPCLCRSWVREHVLLYLFHQTGRRVGTAAGARRGAAGAATAC